MDIVTFDIAPVTSSIIMVAGIGGGGGNAVNHMFRLANADVSFMVCNTDKQALERSPVPNKIMLGNGLGAGNKPERARQAAMDSVEEIKEALTVNDTKMLFVTAGMGGGTGTGAAPVVARIAKDMGILTVGIVSIPFKGEGPKRVEQAIAGIEELSGCVDSLIVINNEHIAQIYGKLGISQALAKADDILAMAAKSIADIITAYADVNVDFADVTTIMKDSGVALMGSAVGGGEDRALIVAEAAVNSPLLHHNSILGAKNVLLNITSGNDELTYDESLQILSFIQERSGLDNQTDVIWGAGRDESLGDDIRITIVATGFDVQNIPAIADHYKGIITPAPGVRPLEAMPQREVIDFEAPEVPLNKKAVDPSADGFEVVTRQADRIEVERPRRIAADKFTAERRIHNTNPAATVESSVESASNGTSPVESPVDSDAAHDSAVDTMIHVDDKTLGIPAYMRRNMKLYSTPRDPALKSEKLDQEISANRIETSNVSLFDQ
ncbi:MAG: cell division protein FtsZ [Mucinivorans sp.]